jgi:hypothetical protein
LQLRRRTEGVLSHQSQRGTASTPVRFTLTGEQITLLVPSDAVGPLVGSEVTLALNGTDADGLHWVVRASGIAFPAVGSRSSVSLSVARRRHPSHGPEPYLDDVLRLPVTRVRGFYETAFETGDRVLPDDGSELTGG